MTIDTRRGALEMVRTGKVHCKEQSRRHQRVAARYMAAI